MEIKLTKEDRKRIEESIRQKYIKVAITPEGLFKYKTGREGLDFLNYDTEIIQSLPDGAVASFCGPIHEGEEVLDIGCGTGVDTLIAAIKVGSMGRAVGIDMIHEMINKAKKNLCEMPLKNVTFQQSSAEDLPFPRFTPASILNGVITWQRQRSLRGKALDPFTIFGK